MTDIREKTSKGLAWSGIMSISTQGLGIVFTIIISRALTPSDFGMVGMLSIFTMIGTTIQDGGLLWALTNRKVITKEQYSTVFYFNLLVSIILYIILFYCAPFIASYFRHPELLWLSRYIFLGILFAGFGIVQNTYLYKEIKVKERAIASMASVLISGLVGIYMAYQGYAYWGIATQGLLSILLNTIIIWILSPFRPVFVINMKFIKEIMPDGIRFLVPNIFSSIGENIFSFILGKKMAVADVGNFTQASKWNMSATSLIINMMRNVTQPVLVQYVNDKELFVKVYRKLYRLTAFLICPLMCLLSLESRDFIAVVLTEKWISAAPLLSVLALGGAITTLNTVSSYFVMSINRSRTYMAMGILSSILNILGAIFAIRFGSIGLTYSYLCVAIIIFILYYYLISQTHDYTILDLINDIFPVLIVTIVCLFLTSFVINFIDSRGTSLWIAIILFVSLYLVVMKVVKNDSYLELENYLLNKLLLVFSRHK